MYVKCHLHTENRGKETTWLKVITGLLSSLVSDISDLASKHKETERSCPYVRHSVQPCYSMSIRKRYKEIKGRDAVIH